MALRGAQVVVVDLSPDAAETTVRRIAEAGGEAIAIAADATDEAACAQVCAETVDRFGRLDMLVNNIGIGDGTPVVTMVEEDWDQQFAVNLKTAVFMTKHAVPRMEQGGSIVNVSSVAVETPTISASYGASKAALEALTRHIAFQHGPDGIRCNAIRPGELWTAMVDRHCPDEEAADRIRGERRQRTALQSDGDAWDAAEAILFLAGPGAAFITAQVLTIDGGAGLIRPNPDWRAHHSYWKAPKR
jgi:NAD(P)-dependent dehydrogenase (short-subunit alcohol dehydrogenase family)